MPFKSYVKLADTFARLFMTVPTWAVELLWVLLGFIHGLMLLFLIYVVYCVQINRWFGTSRPNFEIL
jgi:phage shock protein PspC (stress-responsive transcriptional regulator)